MNLMQHSLKAVMIGLVVLPFLVTSCDKDDPEEDWVTCSNSQYKCILQNETDTCCPKSARYYCTEYEVCVAKEDDCGPDGDVRIKCKN